MAYEKSPPGAATHPVSMLSGPGARHGRGPPARPDRPAPAGSATIDELPKGMKWAVHVRQMMKGLQQSPQGFAAEDRHRPRVVHAGSGDQALTDRFVRVVTAGGAKAAT
jgi:hypothetical protein